MKVLDDMLDRVAFGAVCLSVLAAPWLFGAVEMWWFWIFAVPVFFSALVFGTRLLIRPATEEALEPPEFHDLRRRTDCLLGSICVGAFLVFLVYALIRSLQADVFMSAERSFMLFLTPFLIGIQIVFGWNKPRIGLFHTLLMIDFLFLAIYGIANHYGWDSRHVMWAAGFRQYQVEHRATGSYFCPDHFSGAMELGLCVAAGRLLSKGQGRLRKAMAAILALASVWAIVLSKSRGGALTALVLGGVVIVWGFNQWPPRRRWLYRFSAVCAASILVLAFLTTGGPLLRRFKNYVAWDTHRNKPAGEMTASIAQSLRATTRGWMIAGALRAWKTNKAFGIGPGMHQNLWPHFSASEDADRDLGFFPSIAKPDYHSFEVHSDWIQLLEEYGMIGLILFLMPACAVLTALLIGIKREAADMAERDWHGPGSGDYHFVPAALLAFAAMAFHSLGDFNMQMPATVWLFAAIISMGMSVVLSSLRNDTGSEPEYAAGV